MPLEASFVATLIIWPKAGNQINKNMLRERVPTFGISENAYQTKFDSCQWKATP